MARPTILIGPPVAQMTREAAVEALKQNPKYAGADIEVSQHAGHWIAAFVEKKAGFKEAAPFGGPADGDEESPAPKGESSGGGDDGGDDSSSGGPDDDGLPSDDDGAPKKKHPGEGGGGLEQQVHQLLQQIEAISQALGIPPVGMGPDGGLGPDSMDAGPPAGPPGAGGPPPPHAGHPGMGGPPGGPPGAGAPPPQKVMHEKAGPPPPATFASVKQNHPWGHMIGEQPFFQVAEKLANNESYSQVEQELQHIAKAGGFRIARFTPLEGRQGEKAVHAVIETPRVQR